MNRKFLFGLGLMATLWLALAATASAWYDPTTRSFLSRDPIREAGGINLYAYCEGDPIGNFDPIGLDPAFAPGIGIWGGLTTEQEIGAAEMTAGITAYRANKRMFEGDAYKAAVATWNPAYIARRGAAEWWNGMGLQPGNLGTDLGKWERRFSLGEAVLGGVGTVGVGFELGVGSVRGGPWLLRATSGRSGLTLFRGTSASYPGSSALQRIAVTPASTDPVVSTIFATESANYGEGVLHMASPQALRGVQLIEGNVLASLESEIGVALTPAEFAARANKTITAAQARTILRKMGISVPSQIANPAALNTALQNAPKLTPAQIQQFINEANGL